MVTVAVRRVNISDKNKARLMDYIATKKIMYISTKLETFKLRSGLGSK